MVKPLPVWLLGCRGMLGRQLHRALQHSHRSVIATDQELDIRDIDALRQFSRGEPVSWIINCAAYTAVDAAETDRDNAFALNARGPENLARIAAEINCPLLHMSSDYVFNGQSDQPYREEDEPDPQSVYGASKRAGEEAVIDRYGRHIILRISWLYGVYGRNFIETMLHIFKEKGQARVVNDQYGAPCYAAALADNITRLVNGPNEARGIFHYADGGEISWYDFACAVADEAIRLDLLDKYPQIDPISSSEYPSPARRPASSLFCKTKAIKELGFAVQPWRENLAHYFEERRTLHATI